MTTIRRCRDDELPTIFSLINAAAEAYRGIIPDDCFHEPYMPLSELQAEIAAGSHFGAMRKTELRSASWESSPYATLI
jgi:hypothetical protein